MQYNILQSNELVATEKKGGLCTLRGGKDEEIIDGYYADILRGSVVN